MVGDYLRRGVLAGILVGLAYGLYVALVTNPLTEYVVRAGHEHAHEHGHDHGHGQAVSETTTAAVSVGSGVLWAVLLGGVFALALYALEPALPGRGAAKSYVLAGAGFLSASATPWLVLPPAAPGAEHLYGVETRLAIYGGLVALGIAVSAAAIVAYRAGSSRHRLLGIAGGAVPVLAVAVVLPVATPTVVTHPGLDGELVAAYRALTALSQAALWAALAATFNWLRRRGRDDAERVRAHDEVAAGVGR